MEPRVKIVIDEDPERVIGSREHNMHVAQGANLRRRTMVAPSALMAPLDEGQAAQQRVAQDAVERELRRVIGEPFYSRAGYILYCGDSLDFLRKLLDSDVRIDLALTSPPYNIGKEYERELSLAQYVSWCSEWMTLLHRICNDSGAFWLNLGYFEVPGKGRCVPIPYLLWDRSPFYLLQEVVWVYGAGVSARQRLSPRNEKWLFYVRSPSSYTFRLDDIRDPNVKYPNQKKNGKFRCHPLGKNPSDVWEFPKVTTGTDRSSKERTAHPAQFPLAVVERIVKASSEPGQLILDPFAGSGSAGIAAAGLGRVFLGFEIRRDYCELAAKRFERYCDEKRRGTRQPALL